MDEDKERQASCGKCDETHDDIAGRGQLEAREEGAPRSNQVSSRHLDIVRVLVQRGAEQSHETTIE